jgi:hypothetical protein
MSEIVGMTRFLVSQMKTWLESQLLETERSEIETALL